MYCDDFETLALVIMAGASGACWMYIMRLVYEDMGLLGAIWVWALS